MATAATPPPPSSPNTAAATPTATTTTATTTTKSTGRTHLAFHHDGVLTTLSAVVRSIYRAESLHETDRAAFKGVSVTEADYVVVTDQTVFHPQGGGQPSDEGTMVAAATTDDTDNSTNADGKNATTPAKFTVIAVRMALSPDHAGQVLHLGNFLSSSSSSSSSPSPTFHPNQTVTQHLDVDKRTLYSRYHTAGHVLGSAVRHLLSDQVPDFDELKASHFPDAAACEFAGLIDGAHKGAIQARVDDYLARDMSVEIEFWTERDFVDNGLARLIPGPEVRAMMGMGMGRNEEQEKEKEEERFRVVRIRGAEVYPCGGTHVASTRLCGDTRVKKISRQKGRSRVSYQLV